MIVHEKYFLNWKNLIIHESSTAERGVSLKLKNFLGKKVNSLTIFS